MSDHPTDQLHNPAEQEMPRGAPLAHTVEHGLIEPQNVGARLRAGAQKKRARTTIDVPLPGYDGLFVTFKQLKDYGEVRDRYLQRLRRQGTSDAQKEIGIATETLLAASTGAYAVIDGQRHDLPGDGLSIELYDAIWPAERPDEVRPDTDGAAALLLLDGNTIQLTTLAAELEAWFKDTTRQVGESLGE